MGRYFVRGTPLAALEREMMTPPNFIPRSSGRRVLCRFRYRPEDVDCRNCLQYRRKRCSEPVCPYLTERLEDAGIREYTLYRAAKGIYQGRLGISSEELADEALVPDNTLLLILSAALTARFGPEVMNVGRTGT